MALRKHKDKPEATRSL